MRKEIITCDRCGKEIEKEMPLPRFLDCSMRYDIYLHSLMGNDKLDFCEECQKDFNIWLGEKKNY